jgi:hypothetical protein
MNDHMVMLHLTRHQRDLIRRHTGKDAEVLVFRMGELCDRIAIQQEEESDDARLEDLLLHQPV